MGVSIFPEPTQSSSPYNRQSVITSSGNFVHPDGASSNNPKLVKAIIMGGGGGGAGNTGGPGYAPTSGGPGGSGYVHSVEIMVTGTVPVVIGSAGNAGVNQSYNTGGGSGGYSSFDNIRAQGGGGGGYSGGVGGGGSTGVGVSAFPSSVQSVGEAAALTSRGGSASGGWLSTNNNYGRGGSNASPGGPGVVIVYY